MVSEQQSLSGSIDYKALIGIWIKLCWMDLAHVCLNFWVWAHHKLESLQGTKLITSPISLKFPPFIWWWLTLVNKKDIRWATEHHLSKFEQSVIVNLMPILDFFGIIPIAFCSRNFWSQINHHLMANIWGKAISILEGNLNLGRSYLITTVINQMKKVIIYLWFRRCQSGNTAQVIGCNGIMEETQLLQDTYSTYIYRFSYRFFPHYIILGILECLKVS